jgi:hypothetical protein
MTGGPRSLIQTGDLRDQYADGFVDRDQDSPSNESSHAASGVHMFPLRVSSISNVHKHNSELSWQPDLSWSKDFDIRACSACLARNCTTFFVRNGPPSICPLGRGDLAHRSPGYRSSRGPLLYVTTHSTVLHDMISYWRRQPYMLPVAVKRTILRKMPVVLSSLYCTSEGLSGWTRSLRPALVEWPRALY